MNESWKIVCLSLSLSSYLYRVLALAISVLKWKLLETARILVCSRSCCCLQFLRTFESLACALVKQQNCPTFFLPEFGLN